MCGVCEKEREEGEERQRKGGSSEKEKRKWNGGEEEIWKRNLKGELLK